MSLIKTEQLSREFHQGETVIYGARDVSIEIEKGELVAITGKSGSGKTTLLNLLGGIDKPTGGKVFIGDTDIYAVSDAELATIRRQKIGYVFQSFNLIPILTAEENIILPLLLDGKKRDEAYLREIAEILDISDRLQHLPSELSGGQKQRVAIARALVNHPDIILADEPTGNLDKTSADELLELFLKLNALGHTIVLVTHDAAYANLCHRKLLISDGIVSE